MVVVLKVLRNPVTKRIVLAVVMAIAAALQKEIPRRKGDVPGVVEI